MSTKSSETLTKLDKFFTKKLKFEPHKYAIPGEYFKTFINKKDGRSILVKIVCHKIELSSMLGYTSLSTEINEVTERYNILKSKLISEEALEKMKPKKRRKIELKNDRIKVQSSVLRKTLKFYNKSYKKLSKRLKKLGFELSNKGFGKSPVWMKSVGSHSVVTVQLQVVYYHE